MKIWARMVAKPRAHAISLSTCFRPSVLSEAVLSFTFTRRIDKKKHEFLKHIFGTRTGVLPSFVLILSPDFSFRSAEEGVSRSSHETTS